MIVSGVNLERHRSAGLKRICFAAAVVATVTGCASARVAQPESMPSSSEEGRQELAALEREIAAGRAALGLSPREGIADLSEPPPPGMKAPGAGGPSRDIATESGEDAAAAPQAAPAEVSPMPNSPPAHRSSEASLDREETCPGPCRFTQAICKAAGRICRIAGYLGESDAQQRCQRAQQDCAEARRTTADSCPDC